MKFDRTTRTQRANQVSVIMPVYNEIATVERAINCVLASNRIDTTIELVIVESGSTDGSAEIVGKFKDHPRVKIITEAIPLGKGHAVRAGFSLASGDIIAIFDGDDEYTFSDIWKVIEPIEAGKASFVLGSRHSAAAPLRTFETNPWLARSMNVAHWMFTWMVNVAFDLRLRDPFTMWKVFRREILDVVELTCNRFDLDWEIVGKFAMAGYKPLEVPIEYQSRDYSQGKKVKLIADPISWVITLLRIRFNLDVAFERIANIGVTLAASASKLSK